MTREEVIDGLEIYTAGRLNKDRVHITVEELQKFIDEIKALEQEPCEDCISRQAVINAIANTCFWLSTDNWKELMKCIDSLPSVTPQPKSGKWENISDGIEYDW